MLGNMKMAALPRVAQSVSKGMFALAMAVFLSFHAGAASAQSVSLVMGEAARQRECAAAAVAAGRQPNATPLPPRCREAAPISSNQVFWSIAVGLMVLVGGFVASTQVPKPRR